MFEQLGSPSKEDLRNIIPLLSKLRQNIIAQDMQQINHTAEMLSKANMFKYLQAFQSRTPGFIDNEEAGWVYILSTREQPNILKIGMTRRSVVQRVKEINAATGVLFPLSARAVFRVSNAAKAEKEVFAQLSIWRLRTDREFFDMPFNEAIAIVEKCLKENEAPSSNT